MLTRRFLSIGLRAALLGLLVSAAAQAQMTLPGKFEVTDTGSASYTIPISIAPGTAGLEPKLSLQYDSRSGNGLLGVGWSLAGLPAITRCGRTIAQDGQVGGVAYDANDRFCLDGQRLIALDGGTYGADGTEYRTERESFSKVVSYGQAGSGPSHFKVWTKAGLVMEFGNTADSRIEAQGKASVRVWALNKTSDTKGNYFTVSYTEDNANGEYRPDRIDYTGNNTSNTQPHNSVRFVYEARPDVVPMYQAGSLIKTTRRMTKAQAWQGANLTREYQVHFAIGLATQRSRVAAARVCDNAGICLPATGLTYVDNTVAGAVDFSIATANPVSQSLIGSSTEMRLGDWNGDGKTGVMLLDRLSANTHWYVSNGVLGATPSFSAPTVNPISRSLLGSSTSLYFGDWNGDGLVDIMLWDRPSAMTYWFTNTGMVNGVLTFSAPIENLISRSLLGSDTQIFVGDWNGDGRSDVMLYDPPGANTHWYVSEGAVNGALAFSAATVNPISRSLLGSAAHMNFGDWNGDGLVDLMLVNRPNATTHWFLNAGMSGGNVTFTAATLNPVPASLLGASTELYFGDWNGDGNTDVMFLDRPGANTNWFISTGGYAGTVGFTGATANPVSRSLIGSATVFSFGDWNGDGLSDLVMMDRPSATTHWFTNKGYASGQVSFSSPVVNPLSPSLIGASTVLEIGDWNGDGLSDAMLFDRPSASTHWFHNASSIPDRLFAIGGLSSTQIGYGVLSQGAMTYNRDTGVAACTYPRVDVQGPLYVVSEVRSSNGLGGEYRSTYRYAGAKADRHGRGFLSFRQMTVKDEQTGVEQVTSYRQDYPFTGLVASREKKLGAQLLNRSSNTYGSTDLGGTRRYPFLTASLEESWELTGAALPAVTTAYQYDTYGNATQVGVSTGDGHSKTTVNTYSNDSTNWLLGRLTRSEVTSTAPGN
jgi:uncharacterized protein (DUF3820 family)